MIGAKFSKLLALLIVVGALKMAAAQELKFTNHTELGLLLGEGDRADTKGLSFNTFNGVQLSSALQVGISVGVNQYGSLNIMPVGLGLRGEIGKHKIVPYYSLDVGRGFDWLEKETPENYYSGGWFLSPALGLKLATKGSSRISFSIGYNRQLASSSTVGYNGPIFFDFAPNYYQPQRTEHQEYEFNRISLRLGVSF